MKKNTQNTTTARELNMNEFAQEMLAAEASGAVDKIEVPHAAKHTVTAAKLERYAVQYALKISENGATDALLIDRDAAYQCETGIWGGHHLAGIYQLSEALGLEDNTLVNSGWGFCYLGDEFNISEERKQERYLAVAQFIGFCKAIISHDWDGETYVFPSTYVETHGARPVYPALYAINKKAYSGRGHNSPYTGKFVNEYHAVTHGMNKGEKSPGKLERAIWATKEAALRKHGINVSFEIALEAIGVAGFHPGKAATVAFALKLGWLDSFNNGRWGLNIHYAKERGYEVSYGAARDFVVKVLLARRVEAQDLHGLETHLLDQVAKKGSIRVFEAVWMGEDKYKVGWVWAHGNEFFHSDRPDWGSPKKTEAWRHVIGAFKRRKAEALEREKVADVVDPDKGVLVTLQDSYAVGNCEAGTAAWMRQSGFEGQTLVPLWKVHEAAEKSDNNLARNVVKSVVAEYLQQQGAAWAAPSAVAVVATDWKFAACQSTSFSFF